MESSSSAEETHPRYTSALPLFSSNRQPSPERKNSWKKRLHKILDPHLLTRSRLLLLEAELADQDANRGARLHDDVFIPVPMPEPGRGGALNKKPLRQKLKTLLLKNLSKLNCFASFRRGSQPQSPYPRQSVRFSEDEQVKRIMARGLRPNLFRVTPIEEEP
jgi:hypothetical protein